MKGAIHPRTGHTLAERFLILIRLGLGLLAQQVYIANITLNLRPRFPQLFNFLLQLDPPLLVHRMLNLLLFVSELLVHDVFN